MEKDWRRDVRGAEGARLESVCLVNSETVGSNPTLSANYNIHLTGFEEQERYFKKEEEEFSIGRARWGASGALYLKSAIAGPKAFLRGAMAGRSQGVWP